MRTLFLSFLLMLLASVQSFAAQDCDKARSSADVMKCLTRQHEAAKKDLNAVFDKFVGQTPTEGLAEIKDIQARWLEYRDLECAQEAADFEAESLKRLESLRCMNRLTLERVSAIEKSFQNEKEAAVIGEAAAQPRWMNALAEDNPDIFWRYGARTSGDLDCDGEAEQIMSGAHVANEGAVKPVVSISDNPSTGRPESAVVTLELMDEDEAATCGLLTKLQYIQQAAEDPAGEEQETKACQNHLIVTAENCAGLKLIWNGESYGFGE